MPGPRVYADLHNADQSEGSLHRLRLTCNGTVEDLARYGIELHEGMHLALWTDDGDDAGNSDPMYYEGRVEYDAEGGFWAAWVDMERVRHASDDWHG
jgi:hypothetical protein